VRAEATVIVLAVQQGLNPWAVENARSVVGSILAKQVAARLHADAGFVGRQ
jgi:hypothetical protein